MFGQRDDLLDFWQQPLIDVTQLVMPEAEQFRILEDIIAKPYLYASRARRQSLMLGLAR